MMTHLDPVLLARLQFAFTISFHIIFPAFTIGLASWLAVVEWRLLKTGNRIYEDIYRMWVKVFAVTFGMGVVSGVVMSYQFGTNWSVFADRVGSVIGPL
ncbi:MAG: cytochrome ubiquinol oxidase subunit I, partial [Desulfobacterales bacterium]